MRLLPGGLGVDMFNVDKWISWVLICLMWISGYVVCCFGGKGTKLFLIGEVFGEIYFYGFL